MTNRQAKGLHTYSLSHSLLLKKQQIASCKFGKRHCNRQLVRGDGACATGRERRDNSETGREEIMLDLAGEKGSYGIPPLYRCARETLLEWIRVPLSVLYTTGFYWAPRASLLLILSAKWLILYCVRQNLSNFSNASFDRSRKDYKSKPLVVPVGTQLADLYES